MMISFESKFKAASIIEDKSIKDWDIYTQDGPSEDTMLVSQDANVGILWDDLFGYNLFPLPLSRLKQCGWIKVGSL